MSGPNHDIRSNAGRTIYMPEYYRGEEGFGNLALPNVYNADDATALYPRGTKFVTGERVFFYGTYEGVVAHGGTTVSDTSGDDLAFKFLFTNVIQSDMATGLLIRKQANEQHIVYQTTISAARYDDWYSGGWVTGKDTTPADERMFSRYIVEHEYSATGSKTQLIWNASTGAYTEVDLSAYTEVSVLELDQPCINAKTTMATTLMRNPWKSIVWQSDTAYTLSRGRVMGACMHNDVTYDRHTWFQTYGPMFSPHLEVAVGTLGCETVICMADGSISVRGTSYDRFATGTFMPIVGFVISDAKFPTGSAVTELLPMIFVTLQR